MKTKRKVQIYRAFDKNVDISLERKYFFCKKFCIDRKYV